MRLVKKVEKYTKVESYYIILSNFKIVSLMDKDGNIKTKFDTIEEILVHNWYRNTDEGIGKFQKTILLDSKFSSLRRSIIDLLKRHNKISQEFPERRTYPSEASELMDKYKVLIC